MAVHRSGLLALVLAAVIGLALAAAVPAWAQQRGRPGQFDYYVLTLSWSPAYCAAKGDKAPAEQCGKGTNYGFVVHGLWPQYQKGYPASCATSRKVPEDVVDATLPIMPSEALMNHEWEKHGTCSGVDVVRYFDDLRAAFFNANLPESLINPPAQLKIKAGELVDTLVKAGRNVPGRSIVASCENGKVNEVMFCLNKDLTPRPCAADLRGSCGRDGVLVR